MKSRLTLMAAVLLALAAAPAVAQNPQGPPPGGGRQGFGQRRMQLLLNGITLTAVQQAQVDSIQTVYRAKMPTFTPGAPPDSAARAQRMEMTGKMDADIRAVLTPEQQTVWDRNVADMRSMMQRRGPGA